eukprot:3335037-Heterocapsa_arctica.AAC.2
MHNLQIRKEGTRIPSINLSGSQPDFEFMLDHCKDHVMLIQEHLETDNMKFTAGKPWPTSKVGKEFGNLQQLLRTTKMESQADPEE